MDRMTGKQRSWAIPVILLAIGMVTAPGRVSLAQDSGSGAAATRAHTERHCHIYGSHRDIFPSLSIWLGIINLNRR